MIEFERAIGEELAVGDAAVSVLDAHAERAGHPMVVERVAFIARDGGRIVGRVMGAIIYDWAYLRFLAVAAEARGRGVGSALIARFEETVRAAGCTGVTVDTFAFQAPAFYERRGYVELGRLTASDPARTRLYFVKRLQTEADPDRIA